MKNVHSLTSRKPIDACDGLPFVFGILTWLNQFSNSFNQNTLFSIIGGYINTLQIITTSSSNELNEELLNLVKLVDELALHGNLSKKIIHQHIPDFINRILK